MTKRELLEVLAGVPADAEVREPYEEVDTVVYHAKGNAVILGKAGGQLLSARQAGYKGGYEFLYSPPVPAEGA